MRDLVLVTHNRHKFGEAVEVAKKYDVALEMPNGNIEKLEIQSDSLEEVSKFSAVEAFKKIGRPLVVDDSGLFIDALRGFPGVYSAPVFATIGNQGMLKLMDSIDNRKAHFECCVSFYDGRELRPFVETVEGEITKEVRGDQSFGFDPIFAPHGYEGKSFGEIDVGKKNKISHRGKAFDSFFKWYSHER